MTDRIIRSMTSEGSLRVMNARTTDIVRAVATRQGVEGEDARVFGDLLTAATLVRETMAPSERAQLILTLPGVGQLVADSRPDEGDSGALLRGLFNLKPGHSVRELLGPGATLKAIRSLPTGDLHQSIVAADGADINEVMMTYLQGSEQVLATLAVATVVEGAEIVAAGGFVVQVLPEVDHNLLGVMTERLDHDFKDLDATLRAYDDAQALREELLYRMPYTELFSGLISTACSCSDERVITALATLGRKELEEIIATGEVISLTCDYCRTPRSVSAEQLRTLLTPN